MRAIATIPIVASCAAGVCRGEPIEFDAPIILDTPATSPALAFARFDVESGYDLLTTVKNQGSIALFQTDDGEILAPVLIHALSNPTLLAIADFNADGYLDAVVASDQSQQLAVLEYAFPGTFSVTSRPLTNGAPIDLVTADLDADGDADILAVNIDSGVVTLLYNDGNGVFPEKTTVVSSGFPTGVVVSADFDLDGKPDVATCNFLTDSVTLHKGVGEKLFQVAGSIPVGSRPSALATGDFNNDGAPDLLTANQNSGSVTFLPGNGDGTFAAGTTLSAGSQPIHLLRVDIDADGDDDAVVALARQAAFTVIENTQNGLVSHQFTLPGTQRDASAGDLDGDGILDLAFASADLGRVWVLRNATEATKATGPTPCPGDCDENRRVDFNDLVCILMDFGFSGFQAERADCDQSGSVNFSDLICALSLFGTCSQSPILDE